MFVDPSTASRIERAEAQLTRLVTEAVLASGRAPHAFVRELGDGVASYLRPGSPMNKLIGVGLDGPLDTRELADVETAHAARSEPVRVELCTLARLESSAQLTQRGYHLAGFENVLVHPLSTQRAERKTSVRVERVTAATQAVWQETTVAAVNCPDETGVPVAQGSRRVIEDAIADVLEACAFERYLAFIADVPVGASSLLIQAGIAHLSGSATLLSYRRQGVQRALLESRIEQARARGAELAVLTTAPGSQSQANVMKCGFALAYSRALWESDARPA